MSVWNGLLSGFGMAYEFTTDYGVRQTGRNYQKEMERPLYAVFVVLL